MKHLETIEAAAGVLGKTTEVLLPKVDHMEEKLGKAVLAVAMLFVFSEAAWKAEDKTIDWDNSSQLKHLNWWDMRTKKVESDQVGSGAGFSFHDDVYAGSRSLVGSRLVFPSSAVARFMAKQHYQLYRDMMVIEK